MAEILGAIVNAVNCICSTSTCNYIDQHRNFNDDVDDLTRRLEILTSRKQDVESTLEEAAHSGQMVKKEVNEWLRQVEDVNGEVRALLEKVRRVKWYKRAWLGRLVRRKINMVEKIHEQGSFTGDFIIEKGPIHGNTIPTENLVGEISTKEEIWRYLMGDEVGMIGVCGIGGVGKTTIMEHVCNDLRREARFQHVIWVTVSYPLDIFELQKKIAHDMKKRLPEDVEQKMRAAALMEIMTRVRFVLILDDVWEKFSLKEVGIPEPVQNGCKVVITSRKIDVCNYLHCKIVKMQPLSSEKSLKLFLDTVGDGVSQVPGLEDILKLIVKECAGLPLAIVVIAASMRGVDDVNVWRNALVELRERVKSVSGWDDEIFQRLRFSYDRLNSLEIQKCFLYCSLFREDYEFSKMELIEGWIDDGLIDIGDFRSRQEAYDRGHAFLDKLVKNCLIEKTAHLFEDAFKMHDVVRDMAIKSVGPEFGYMVKELTAAQKEHGWVKDVRKLSLMAIHISKLPVDLSLKCLTLSTLILSGNHLSEIPNSIFEDMGTLKVLDLSHTGIEALPDSISNLENLTALRLRSCEKLKSLPSLEKLGALKKLDLRGAGINVVPQGVEMLECLEYLDLCCRCLKEIPTGILSKLSNLQYLVTATKFQASQVRINVEELARLRKLEILKCGFDNMQAFNYFLSEFNFQSLTAYELKVGPSHPDSIDGTLEHKYTLEFCGCDIGKGCTVLPDRLQYLMIHDCKNTGSSLTKTFLLENATKLTLCVSACEEIENVVELDSSSSSLCRPILDKLKHLEVTRCSGMRKLLSLDLLQALQNLESIVVEDCLQMEEIIATSVADASLDKFTFTFPKLRKLRLFDLPQLKSICSAKGVMVCDSIEEIWIVVCPKLKRIPVQLPLLENGQPSPPPRLRKIYIHKDSKEWWESMEWDHPDAKNLLQPFVEYWPYLTKIQIRQKMGICK